MLEAFTPRTQTCCQPLYITVFRILTTPDEYPSPPQELCGPACARATRAAGRGSRITGGGTPRPISTEALSPYQCSLPSPDAWTLCTQNWDLSRIASAVTHASTPRHLNYLNPDASILIALPHSCMHSTTFKMQSSSDSQLAGGCAQHTASRPPNTTPPGKAPPSPLK